MLDDPRDRSAYRIAITMLGLALIVAIAGACWVAAEHRCLRNIPTEIWFLPVVLGGVLVGIMIPIPLYYSKCWGIVSSALLCLTVAGVGAAALVRGGVHHHSTAFYAIAAGAGAILVGLPVPAPGRR